MKQNKPSCLLWCAKVMLLVAVVCIAQTKLLAANNKSEIFFNKKNFDDDKKRGRRERSFKNESVVRVVPDAFKKSVHITAKPTNERAIDFLVFDINGNMVADYKMKAGEKRTLNELKKGSYMYHVFAEDEYLASGKIEFR